MNIHIDTYKFNHIMQKTYIYGIYEFGSCTYGLADNKSDKDYLVIYAPFESEVFSPFVNHHQYQYKDVDNNIDYVLMNLNTYIKNLVNGDSVINYEILYNETFKRELFFKIFSDNVNKFKTYNIVKAYLGMAKRDLKYLVKRKTNHDYKRGLLHIFRSLSFAEMILNDNFNLKNDEIINFKKILDEEYDNLDKSKQMLIKENFVESEKKLRCLVTDLMQKKQIPRYLDVSFQKEITEHVIKYNNYTKTDFSLYEIYETNENVEIKYE